jgi:hypothetical protein
MDTNALAESMVAEKKISGQWPLSQLFSIFDTLTQFDVQIEAKLAKFKKFATIGFIVAVISFFGTIFGMNVNPNIPFLTVPLLVISLVVGIVGLVLMFRYKKMDLQNEFREYLRPLLENLQDDLKRDAPVSLELSLDPVEQKQFSKGRSDQYSVGVYHKCYDYSFERDFLNVKLRLNDGNRLMLTGTEVLIKTSKTKRNPRGKYKTKTKYKKRVMFDVRLSVDSEKFQCKQLPKESTPKFYAKQSNGTPIIGIKFTEKLKGLPDSMVPDPNVTLQHLVTLYSHVQAKPAS